VSAAERFSCAGKLALPRFGEMPEGAARAADRLADQSARGGRRAQGERDTP